MTDRFTYLWRLSPIIWKDDETFARLAALFETCPEAADEIAFFIAEPTSNAYYPPERFEEDLAVYEKRAAWFRAHGKKTGINVWPTFGVPGEMDCPGRPKLPEDFEMMVGMDGSVDPSVPCPLSPGFLRHVTARYRRMAQAKPDFIWVDDDTRFTYITTVPYPCFCDRCVSGFQDGHWTRETLVEALNRPENQALRAAWCDYGGERLALFCRELRRAVDEIDPSIDLPFMSTGQTHSTYSGNYVTRCMEELRSRRGRPGHGFYWDDAPEGRFWKAMEVGRQVKQFPACTQSSVWEEESHPGAFLNKASATRLSETLLSLVMGGDGIAFNHLAGSAASGPYAFREYEREFQTFAKAKPALQEFLRFASGLPRPGGFWPLDSIHMMAAMDCSEGWFREGGFNYSSNTPWSIDKPESLSRMGLPLTPFDREACGVVLAGRTMDCLSDDELRQLFSGSVLLDAEALTRLEERGLSGLAGVKAGPVIQGAYERAENHPMNGPFAGAYRLGLSDGCVLLPLGDRVESLSFLESAYGCRYGCCVSRYENELGGKVVAFGYEPWKYLGTTAKLHQLRELARWMGSPAWIDYPESYAAGKLVPFVRSDKKRAAAAVFNAFLDESPAFELWLPGEMTRARLLDLDGGAGEARVRRENGALVVSVPGLRPWREVMVLAE